MSVKTTPDKERIKERLNAVGLHSFAASAKAGYNAHFLYDYFADRKKSINREALNAIAVVLECSPAYLTGESDTVIAPEPSPPSAPETAPAGDDMADTETTEVVVTAQPGAQINIRIQVEGA